VHDLKHTYGHRLRAAGVGIEDRKLLLGHKAGHVTTHYSAPEIGALVQASEKVCELGARKNHAGAARELERVLRGRESHPAGCVWLQVHALGSGGARSRAKTDRSIDTSRISTALASNAADTLRQFNASLVALTNRVSQAVVKSRSRDTDRQSRRLIVAMSLSLISAR
jgi:hypothetical protein